MPEDAGQSEGFFGERVASPTTSSRPPCSTRRSSRRSSTCSPSLAGDGAALEFAIGTGRIALPLAERGVRVAGIDNSEAMVARLRAKPGAEAIDATVGDFATTRVDGEFSLVYLVFNTIFNLVTQDAQVACFENAAAHLAQRRPVRDRDARARSSRPAARPDRSPLPRRPRRDLLRRLRRRHAAVQLPALRLCRRTESRRIPSSSATPGPPSST